MESQPSLIDAEKSDKGLGGTVSDGSSKGTEVCDLGNNDNIVLLNIPPKPKKQVIAVPARMKT
jgi:hypothetical protein